MSLECGAAPEPITRSRGLGPARPGGECFSLRVKVLVPRVSAVTAVCAVSCWEFPEKHVVIFIYYLFSLYTVALESAVGCDV